MFTEEINKLKKDIEVFNAFEVATQGAIALYDMSLKNLNSDTADKLYKNTIDNLIGIIDESKKIRIRAEVLLHLLTTMNK